MCTGIRFSDGSGHLYLARNLDWTSGYGERVVATPTGYSPRSPFGAVPAIRHAVIGMGIVEEDTPLYFDCGNDAGLAVAGLNFPGYAQYATGPVDGATNVAAFEFPLWVASQFGSVDEVEAALQTVAIVDKPINEKFPSSLLHWIIGDANRAIIVEYTADGMHVFDDDVDVLANQPGFGWHHENLRNYLNTSPHFPEETVIGRASLTPFGSGSHMRGIPGDYYSPSRFVRAAYVHAHYPTKSTEEDNVSRAFHTLQQVAMVDGSAAMGSGEFEKTIYTGLFSSRATTYYWNTYDDPAIQSVALADLKPDGSELVVA
ncbi:choloylglycine hydrolase [Cellulomonas dongxiuzhuiae]|uniref:choloylglycine hydrolase n=1 Tax=Cellulomonas dongxiuzhuiae TaxID=2819979 RepID=A0ABX8GJP2_9CELL|nr:choloylglycine hydrolase [Cellulomonas dongxiuzhuiae]MBO3089788.1 choloylglycine hydrolase [Cellulomonas dongxiuzhuiae]MBO3090029.1 choloylglycine hydrolase [Cellulomonas dongxiuzhuiae]MBO3095420.1 choloylglycine hydrolase [Cellulomonas dongxiuzhuiae]QWC16403.1 choloylglycine hydrolase [Cellulomonas dongxiuzhuiae]